MENRKDNSGVLFKNDKIENERSPNYKGNITVDMVKVIRQFSMTKDSVKKLSDQFQVSNYVIRRVLNGMTYKGV